MISPTFTVVSEAGATSSYRAKVKYKVSFHLGGLKVKGAELLTEGTLPLKGGGGQVSV